MSKPKNAQGTPQQKCGACGGHGEKLVYGDGFELDCCPECSADIATDRIAAGAYAYTAAAIGELVTLWNRLKTKGRTETKIGQWIDSQLAKREGWDMDRGGFLFMV